MRITTIIALFAVMLAGTAFAGDSGNGCKLQGVWTVGAADEWILSTYTFQGTGDNEGTFVQEIINDLGGFLALPPELGNPLGVVIPNARYTVRPGIWAKTGPNTYKTKSQGYVVQRTEAFGTHFDNVALVFLDNLTITLTDCNTAEVLVETHYFFPGDTVPFYTWSSAGSPYVPMKRLLMSQEYPFPQ
ncbi:MAG: hypothetical protein JXA73_05100 [Acidobacteria bacterium]|nr:hypothetical protein [Acidobacteriota bacterium]